MKKEEAVVRLTEIIANFVGYTGKVLPDDVKAVWVPVANHRVQAVQQQQSSEMLLKDLLDHVAVA